MLFPKVLVVEDIEKGLGLVHGFSTTLLGNMALKENEAVNIGNRINFLAALNIIEPSCVGWMIPQHKDEIITIPQISGKNWKEGSINDRSKAFLCDGVFARDGVMLFACFADCLPLLIYSVDLENKLVGLFHIGWRGANLRLAAKSIDYICKNFPNNNLGDLRFIFGPAICKDCYSFIEPNRAIMSEMNKSYRQYFTLDGSGYYHSDFVSYVYDQLLEKGINPNQILKTNICTQQDPKFYSNNRDKTANRFAALVGYSNKFGRF